MTIEEKIEKLKLKQEEIAKTKLELQKESELVFDDFCKQVWEKYPLLESFGWTQYTPYFNDGDTCTFNVNTDYLKINGDYAEDSNWFSEKNVTVNGTWNRETRTYEGRVLEDNPDYNQKLVEACNSISNFLTIFDNDFFYRRFGDHCEINITKNGFEVEDYEHE